MIRFGCSILEENLSTDTWYDKKQPKIFESERVQCTVAVEDKRDLFILVKHVARQNDRFFVVARSKTLLGKANGVIHDGEVSCASDHELGLSLTVLVTVGQKESLGLLLGVFSFCSHVNDDRTEGMDILGRNADLKEKENS